MDILEKYLKNNKKVEISFLLNDEKSVVLRTDFYKKTQGSFYLFMPENEAALKVNQEIKIFLYTNDGVYIFSSKIKSLNSKIFEISKPLNYKKIQRRYLLRAEIKKSFYIEENNIKKEYLTYNISGSGISFYSNDLLDKEKLFKIVLDFDKRKIITRIKIIEIRKNLKANLPKYRYSAQFISLNKLDEDYIIQKCIKKNVETINI